MNLPLLIFIKFFSHLQNGIEMRSETYKQMERLVKEDLALARANRKEKVANKILSEFKCELCNMRFASIAGLDFHKKSAHKDILKKNRHTDGDSSDDCK